MILLKLREPLSRFKGYNLLPLAQEMTRGPPSTQGGSMTHRAVTPVVPGPPLTDRQTAAKQAARGRLPAESQTQPPIGGGGCRGGHKAFFRHMRP